ncbi:MAG TPA: hypothetical protein VMK66_21095 [Myxococcales bacterium]|nr:hypothetical protein [Myxococcales bacterium]
MLSAGIHRLVAGMTAAALLGSGGAQALLLHRCGTEVVMKSCCCAKGGQPAARPSRMERDDRACCSVAPAPGRREDAAPQAALSPQPPVAGSVAFAVLPAAPLRGEAGFALVQPAAAGPPILRITCSLLI